MRYKKLVNILLVTILTLSIACLCLTITPCKEIWESYQMYMLNDPTYIVQAMRSQLLSNALQITFALAFSGLIAILSFIAFIISITLKQNLKDGE